MGGNCLSLEPTSRLHHRPSTSPEECRTAGLAEARRIVCEDISHVIRGLQVFHGDLQRCPQLDTLWCDGRSRKTCVRSPSRDTLAKLWARHPSEGPLRPMLVNGGIKMTTRTIISLSSGLLPLPALWLPPRTVVYRSGHIWHTKTRPM